MSVVVPVGVDRELVGRTGAEHRNILWVPADRFGLAGAADMPVDAQHTISRTHDQVEIMRDDENAALACITNAPDQLIDSELTGKIDLLHGLIQDQKIGIL